MDKESYTQDWLHAQIHLNKQTFEMHSDGDHKVRSLIEDKINTLQKDLENKNAIIKKQDEALDVIEHLHQPPPPEIKALGNNAMKVACQTRKEVERMMK